MSLLSKTLYRCHLRLPLALGLCILFLMAAFVRPSSAHAAALDDTSYVRVIHAAPDISTADVFVDGKAFLSNFKFATITAYVPLPAGTHKVQVASIGKGINAAVLSQDLTIQAGTAYTVAALDTKASGFSFSVFTDDNIMNGDGTKVRLYHLSPGMGEARMSTPTSTIVTALTYKAASPYVSLSSGAYTFTLTAATGNITRSSQVTLKPWTVISIFAVGVPQGSPAFQLVTTTQQGIPGLPQTGSDPHAHVVTSPPALWLFLLSAFCLLALGSRTASTLRQRQTSKERAQQPLASSPDKG